MASAALEAEAMKILVGFQKCFLINVARIFRAARQIQRQTQNVAIVTVN
jgi:hypothetical protein